MCKKTGNESLFVHWNRLSSNKEDKFSKVRWDEKFFKERFAQYKAENKGFTQISLCTPPIVQEIFERALDSINRFDGSLHFHIL